MALVASKVPFADLCLVCEKISLKQGSDKKKVLIDFIKAWRDFHNRIHKNDVTTVDSFHSAMQLLLPQFDRDRGPYGIKEHTLAKMYIEILNLNKDSNDAQKLLNYRLPANMKGDAADFATVAYFVLKNRCPENGTLKIADVIDDLDGIADCNAARNKDGVKKHLLHLLRNTSALEQKWLIRMIMKEMKFGLSEQTVLNTFHLDAKDLYDVTNSLLKVCITLRDPNIRLNEIDISIFTPFRPMLAERAAPNKIEKLMQHKTFYIETKHDGERMQLHKRGKEFKYFSRGGNEYTQNYGSDASSGTLTMYIANAFGKDVNECILDGEMMGFNVQLQCTGTKADGFDVKSLHVGGHYQPCYHVFDILLYNGKVLSNVPLKERLAYVEKVFTPVEGRIQFPPHKEGSTKEDVVNALNDAIDNREEGIVVKDPDSVYKPNTRKGGWVKLKPEYVDGVMDELDLLIVGGYFGAGHRKGILSHFLLAVAVPPQNHDDEPSMFHSISRVGSGYTMQELHELCSKLQDHLKPYDKRNPPKSIVLAQGHKERPDVWIEPSKSYIVQVKAAEIVESDKFMTGYTLRFPRVEKIRYDKRWSQCLTLTELHEMRRHAAGKLASKHVLHDDDDQSPKKKRKAAPKLQQQPVVVVPHFRGIDTASIEKSSRLLMRREFYVVNGTEDYSKQDFERLITKHGGAIVQNPRQETMCTLACHETIKVKNIIKANKYDVVKSEWLLRCLRANDILPWTPSDMLHSSPETSSRLMREYDSYGDSYTMPTSAEDLKKIVTNVEETTHMDASAMAELEMKYFPNPPPLGLFRTCFVYVDKTSEEDVAMEITALDLRFHGATVPKEVSHSVSHIVVDPEKCDRVEYFRMLNRKRERKFHLVTPEWISTSVRSSTLLQERRFHP